MKINILLKSLIIVFILVPFSKGEIVRAANYIDVLIVEDSENNYNVTNAVKNILGFYGAKGVYIKDDEYTLDEMLNYDKVIIISDDYDIENLELISDLKEFKGGIFWIGSGVSQILDDNTKEKYSIIWNIKNIWNMVIIPNESEAFFTLAESFNCFFEKENNEDFKMILKITDVSITSDNSKLKEIADYLYTEGVPFVIVLNEIANIKNLNVKENDIIYYKSKEFFNTIKYMVNKGGSVVIKNNSGVYDTINNFIHKDYLRSDESKKSILENFIEECVKNDIYPLGVEISNKEEFENLKNNFTTFMYSSELNNSFKYPFIITNYENYYNIITENIGNIDGNNKAWLENIEYNIKRISRIKGSTATISYSSALDIEYLKELVKSLNKTNIKYINLTYMKNKIDLNMITINSSGGDINYAIDLYNKDDILEIEYKYESLEKNFFESKLNSVLLISILILSIVFISIYLYCKNDNNNKVA